MICAAQVVQSGGKNIELAVIRRNQPLKVIHLIYDFFLYIHSFTIVLMQHSCHPFNVGTVSVIRHMTHLYKFHPSLLSQILESKEIETLVAEIEKEKEEEAEKKKQKKSS